MRKSKAILLTAMAAIALMIGTVTSACPLWECQYDVNDYSCGCQASSCNDYCNDSYQYDEYSEVRQPIYCAFCGNEAWACTCGTGTASYGPCYGSYESYSACGTSMDHWANIRDSQGNIIGQVGSGQSIEVCGVDPQNPDRVLIYDNATGTYGSVLSECVYGGYSWDGSGDNGVYNSYQGGSCGIQQTSYCDDQNGYDYGYGESYDCGYTPQESQTAGCDYSGCVYYSEEMITIVRRCMMAVGGGWLCG